MKNRILGILLAVCFLMPVSVYAGTNLTDKYSDAELIKIIRDDGYSAVTKLKDGVIRIKIEGRTFVLFNKSDGDLQGYYAIQGVNISYEEINEWNRTKRLSRAYLDSDRDPVIESDLLANGGITVKHVTEFFRLFVVSVDSFRSFISENNNN